MKYFDPARLMQYPGLRCAAARLQERYPFLRCGSAGRSGYGRELILLKLGCGPARVLIHGTHHANESITAALLFCFAAGYCAAVQNDGKLDVYGARRLWRAATLYLVPMVNPDGADLTAGLLREDDPAYVRARAIAAAMPSVPFPAGWKANLRGVDLNLNYPAGWANAKRNKAAQGVTGPAPRDYAGPAPLSERESAAMAALTRRVRPALTLSYHTQGREIYWQYRGFAPPGAQRLGLAMQAASGYRLAETPYASSSAGYKDWALQEFGVPGYTVEAGLGENPLPVSDLPQLCRENDPLLALALAAAGGLWRG